MFYFLDQISEIELDYDHTGDYVFAVWRFYCQCETAVNILTGEIADIDPYYCYKHSMEAAD